MKAWVLDKPQSLKLKEIEKPKEKVEELLIKVMGCAICHTDLHEYLGEISLPLLPIILGHQIIGKVESKGEKVKNFDLGELVGVPWLYKSCMRCNYCNEGFENLCDNALFTGLNVNGGFAEYHIVNYNFAYKLPPQFEDITYAPLLCGGVIGWRALKQTNLKDKGSILGLYGIGSSAHIVLQIANFFNFKVFAFSRSEKHRELAIKLGAVWAGNPQDIPPDKMDGAIVFAPKGSLMVQALKNLKKGKRVVSAGIFMDDIPSFKYNLLWEERILTSVANSTRADVKELLNLSIEINFKIETEIYNFEDLEKAILNLKNSKIKGSAILKI